METTTSRNPTSSSFHELHSVLAPYGQTHLLQFWDHLSTAEQIHLADQIHSIDFDLLADIQEQHVESAEADDVASRAEPPSACRPLELDNAERDAARAAGAHLLRSGKCGVVIVAGGQGSRLGFEHPKGMYPIGPVSRASLFQILIEKIRATAERYSTSIPLYLMTSPATHVETVRFLDENDRFGLSEDELFVFCQGTLPGVDPNGRLILSSRSSIFMSPDGHGGMLAALQNSGAFDHMSQRNIEHLFYCQVDNALVDFPGEEFLGYHLISEAEVTTQVIAKKDPLEKVGNVVSIDGRLQIIEYSDLARDAAELRCEDGRLRLWAGNLAVHAFKVDFLLQSCRDGARLPFHVARKKIPFVNDAGRVEKPESPNGIKYEQFIFDLLPRAERAIVVEVQEEECFAPLKNADGKDSAEYVRERMSQLYRRWLTDAGVDVPNNTIVEISPLAALTADDVHNINPSCEPDACSWYVTRA